MNLPLPPPHLQLHLQLHFVALGQIHCSTLQIQIQMPVFTAQGGGGSFKIGNIQEKLGPVKDGWQSEHTNGSKGGWRQSSVVVVVIAVAMSL